LATRPHLDRAFGEAAGAPFNCVPCPALNAGEILCQLEAVARHAHQLFLALRDSEVWRTTARYPREIAQRPDDLPVLLFTDTNLRKPVCARKQRRDQLQV